MLMLVAVLMLAVFEVIDIPIVAASVPDLEVKLKISK